MDSSSRTACHVCGKYFYTAVSLRMHITKVHGKVAGNAEDGKQHTGAGGKKGCLCTVCNRCFPNAGLLKMHARKVHSGCLLYTSDAADE